MILSKRMIKPAALIITFFVILAAVTLDGNFKNAAYAKSVEEAYDAAPENEAVEKSKIAEALKTNIEIDRKIRALAAKNNSVAAEEIGSQQTESFEESEISEISETSEASETSGDASAQEEAQPETQSEETQEEAQTDAFAQEAEYAQTSMIWPAPSSYGTGNISSWFGYRDDPDVLALGIGTMHYGIDIWCPEGTEIYASLDGVVTANGYDEYKGWMLTIYHPQSGLSTEIHHMCAQSPIAVGQSVTQGSVIGYAGSSGAATGSHIHFAVIVDGSYVDPAPYLGI